VKKANSGGGGKNVYMKRGGNMGGGRILGLRRHQTNPKENPGGQSIRPVLSKGAGRGNASEWTVWERHNRL